MSLEHPHELSTSEFLQNIVFPQREKISRFSIHQSYHCGRVLEKNIGNAMLRMQMNW